MTENISRYRKQERNERNERKLTPNRGNRTQSTPKRHEKTPYLLVFQHLRGFFCGLGERIRTSGLLNPIQARYQAAPHPDATLYILACSGPLVNIKMYRGFVNLKCLGAMR